MAEKSPEQERFDAAQTDLCAAEDEWCDAARELFAPGTRVRWTHGRYEHFGTVVAELGLYNPTFAKVRVRNEHTGNERASRSISAASQTRSPPMADLTTSNSIDLYEALRRLLALFETLDEPSGVRVVDAARAELTHLRERVAELEGVVERLPKTADGVRVLPGDKVYWPWTSSGRPLELTCQSRCSASAIGTGSEPMCECYSTPEAAALASEGGRG